MSSVDKLLIRGIRSFSPFSDSVIEFYAPLTIIVGHNGAGKTTIIECLKYATTGDLPPNAKGGAFVHDPKVSRELEVKGQIKLKFKNTRGQTMVVTRSLQSTQKKTKLEQKTLESLLATTDPTTGEQVSISSRCAEMDAEIPLQLGVSRAVLENVLFCHQEDSFWPLSEPSVLKKKFDDIFAATRYTKALDTLKSLRKELSAEVKLEQQKLDYLKADKEKANKLRLEIERNEVRVAEGRDRIAAIDVHINSIQESIKKLGDDLKDLADLQSELERLEHDHNATLKSREDLMQGLVIMNGIHIYNIKILDLFLESDEQLQVILEQLMKRTTSDQGQLNELKSEKVRLEGHRNALSKEYSQKATEKGVMEAELGRIRQKETERDKLVNQLCEIFNIRDRHGSLDTILEDIGGHLEQEKAQLTQAQDELKDSETAFSQRIQMTSTQLSSATELKRMKKKAIEEHQSKLSIIIGSIADAAKSKDRLEELQSTLLEEESTLTLMKQIFEAASYENRLMVLTERRKTTDGEIIAVNKKIASLSAFSEMRAKLELRKAEGDRKTDAINRIWEEVKGEFPSPIAMEDADRESDKLWRLKDRQVKALQERVDKVNSSYSIACSKLDHAQTLHTKKERELAEKCRKLEAICGKEDFGMFFEDTESALDRINTSLSAVLSSKSSYQAFISKFDRTHQCPLCERPFDDKSREEEFGKKLASFIQSLPTSVLELEGEKRTLEDRLQKLKGLRSVSDDVDRLRLMEIPEIDRELKTIQEEKDRAQINLDELNAELGSVVLEEKKISLLKKRCEELGKLTREMASIKLDISNIEAEIRAAGGDDSEDSNTLQSQLAKLQTDSQKASREIDTITMEMRQKQTELLQKEHRYRDLKEQAMKYQLKQSEALHLEKTKGDLEVAIHSLDTEIAEVEREISRKESELKALTVERFEKIGQLEQRVEQLRTSVRERESLFSALHSRSQEIANAQQRCNQDILNTLAEQLSSLDARLKVVQQEIDQCEERISVFCKESSEAQIQERTIRDNLKCRELLRRSHTMTAEIDQLKSKLGTFDRLAATTQLHRQNMRYSEVQGERGGIFGELRQLESQISHLQSELATDYRTIDEDYRDQFIRYNATLTAIEDLEKYAKALDQAIMKFHSYKMSEINRIIKEIWTSTYQGADIDTIEIRADHETSATSTVVGGRSYNYRVVMIKGDTELDMRGRSSAGQRVLTSLIIRLALAETFGQHCGVLALDEPTTNLDRDNIESLANSLAEIIKLRGAQGNFQLIIITHDEEFVDLLGRHECADYYWRVFKDEQQYSSIERQSFQGVM